ncbi:hypothetical protein H0486_15410 [Lachnospiraceae bacterium MD1]|uniref:RNA-binding protein n=1 Tax=Variimorphobacter saccharofermentans TaxID=2755051 RepID=A0A839K4I8_9FIRM|nr:KOW domain-containing RNA-binding protein [Variimorphobacter saccharofermentans]MBB2184267.1 hypothetical protein [Variimorphobacter saccharofermentans]
MMNEFQVGGYVNSIAGHDSGKCYVIFQIDHEYLYLVDGKIRTLDHPKKKKIKHVTMLAGADPEIKEKILNHSIKNEEIKRTIKMLLNRKSSKEAK